MSSTCTQELNFSPFLFLIETILILNKKYNMKYDLAAPKEQKLCTLIILPLSPTQTHASKSIFIAHTPHTPKLK